MTDNSQSPKNHQSKFFNHHILKKLQSAIHSKVGIAVIFTLVGINAAILGIKIGLLNTKEHQNNFSESNFIHDSFFLSNSDIFEEMQQMQNHMTKMFESHKKHMDQIFTNSKKHYAKNNQSHHKNWSKVATREDDDFYIYELSFSGFDSKNITTSIKNSTLTFSAKQERKDESKEKQFYLDNSFYYSFYIPEHRGEPQITKEKDKIIVKLSKK